MASKSAVQVLRWGTSARVRVSRAPSFYASRTFCAVGSLGVRAGRGGAWGGDVVGVRGSPLWQRRWNSGTGTGEGEGATNGIYEFDDILSAIESSPYLLVDVREPHEYNANSIPTAINIPIVSHPEALHLSASDFAARFGFQKPPLAKPVVFFCKAGVRSRAAAGLAKQAGYLHVGEYRGSWNDWAKKGGPGTKTPAPPGGRGEAKGPVTEMNSTESGKIGEGGGAGST